jgi:hypothetical protein
MPAQSRRLPARIALAGLLAALLLPATGVVTAVASSPLTLAVKVGYQGVYKAQEWMPVTIDVKNSGADFEGTIQLESAFTSQPGLPSPALYQMPLSLAAGASKHLRTYSMVNPAAGLTLTVRVLQNGRVLASETATGGTNTSTLIGVLSDDPTALDDFAAVHPAAITAHVAHLRIEDLGESAIVLRAFDLIVIDDYATDTLTSGQRTALSDFVRDGGSLLIGTGASWRKTLAGIPAELQPVQVTSTVTIPNSRALGDAANVEVATGANHSGATTWLAEGAQPLLVEAQLGSGTVTVATFDWNQPAVSGGSGTKTLLRQLMVRDLFGAASQQNFPTGIGGGGAISPFGTSGTSISERSNALSAVLGDLPALDLPSLQLTGLLVLVYVLLVGPINFLVLGRIHRRELSWVTIPLIAVVVAGGAYGIGIGTKGHSVQSNQVAIVHLTSGSDHAYQETYTGILAPTRGDYQVSVPGDRLFISPLSTNGNFGSPTGLTSIDSSTNTVTLQGITAFTLRGFATESVTAAPQLIGHLQMVNGQLTGRVENHSAMTFSDALLMAGDSFQKIGPLAPGASASVSLAVKAANPFGGAPLYTRIYSNTTFGPPPNNPTAADREGQARTQILSLLQPSLGFKGTTSAAIQPLIVAWSHQSLQDIRVNGTEPRATTETAVVLSLSIDQLGAGSLPAGVVTGRLIDVVGETQPAGPPGFYSLTNGSATYEFTPALVPGTHLRAASLSASNPFGAKITGPNGSPASTAQADVWDWTHNAWTSVAYQDNGTTAIPDAGIDRSSGAVRLKISGANATFMTSGISLTGSIQ